MTNLMMCFGDGTPSSALSHSPGCLTVSRLLQDISGALAGLLDWTTWWRAAAGHIGRAVPIRLPRAHRLIQSLYNSYINSYRVTGL
jgi:hypothetical protein